MDLDLRLLQILDDTNDSCHEFHNLVSYAIANRSRVSYPSLSPQFTITFNFFATCEDQKWVDLDQDNVQLIQRSEETSNKFSVIAAVKDLSLKEISDTLEKALIHYMQDRRWRRDLIVFAWLSVVEFYGTKLTDNNIIEIDIHIVVELRHVPVPETGGLLAGNSCCVCLEDFRSGQEPRLLVQLPCSHFFHSECIDNWLRNHRSCPMCRRTAPLNRWLSVRDLPPGVEISK